MDTEDRLIDEIKKCINEKIRPALVMDGGNIEFVDFDGASGILNVKLLGACHGCPMAGITLKNAVEGILKEYVPEIVKVVAIDYTPDDIDGELDFE